MVLITQDIVRTEKLPAASKSPALDALLARRAALRGAAWSGIRREGSRPWVRQLSKARH
jgi:hypothetical protein